MSKCSFHLPPVACGHHTKQEGMKMKFREAYHKVMQSLGFEVGDWEKELFTRKKEEQIK